MGASLIRTARPEDRKAVEVLLRAARLPLEGVAEHFDTFFVVEGGDEIVGASGLELYGLDALLRSVVVAEAARGGGLGTSLAQRALHEAYARGARSTYLLTTTAEAFFARLGFARITRTDVPSSVQASREFQGACPSSATVMRYALTKPA
jgi:amino-acid N-acetyltransferase